MKASELLAWTGGNTPDHKMAGTRFFTCSLPISCGQYGVRVANANPFGRKVYARKWWIKIDRRLDSVLQLRRDLCVGLHRV